MLLACLGDHDPRGAPVKATRRVLRGIATYRSWTVLEVVRALRSGESIKAGRWRYVWLDQR